MPIGIIRPKTYLKTFLALLGLLTLTVGANFADLGPFNVMIAMLVSVAKTLLIILFFMEVRYSPPLVWLFATAGFLWLILMIIMMLNDYETRSWVAPDWRAGVNGSNHVEFAH
jgi:cytochrome c oxidase subunit 4